RNPKATWRPSAPGCCNNSRMRRASTLARRPSAAARTPTRHRRASARTNPRTPRGSRPESPSPSGQAKKKTAAWGRGFHSRGRRQRPQAASDLDRSHGLRELQLRNAVPEDLVALEGAHVVEDLLEFRRL